MIRCAVDEIGKNSVNPSVIDNIIICNKDMWEIIMLFTLDYKLFTSEKISFYETLLVQLYPSVSDFH